MNQSEAIQWLDDHGGRWCVRASSAAILVVASVGSNQESQTITNLTCDDVDDALVDVVDRVRATARRQK